MYGKLGSAAVGAAGSGTLAYTGINVLALVVGALTLIFAGLAVLKLVPRRAERAGS
jgi:hypothetical protein